VRVLLVVVVFLLGCDTTEQQAKKHHSEVRRIEECASLCSRREGLFNVFKERSGYGGGPWYCTCIDGHQVVIP
jgi:hypothetical protein